MEVRLRGRKHPKPSIITYTILVICLSSKNLDAYKLLFVKDLTRYFAGGKVGSKGD